VRNDRAVNDRRALLTAALGFLLFEPRTSALRALHAWLDSWAGLGLVVVGMERQGYRVSITRMDDHWRARFGRDPMISDAGYGVAPTPWGAVQRAAWSALKHAADAPSGP
jgi:hypothetical protein